MIEMLAVEKRFGTTRVLGPLSAVIPSHRRVALIGPSGCGKSTLLRLLVGLVRPDAGRLCFDDAMPRDDDWPGLRRRLGYVIQDGGLFPHLTALENAALVARHLGWNEQRVNRRAEELSALVRLAGEQLARFPAELSGGQRQRVALMRALFLDPEVLLLDEPLGALDPMIRYELQIDLERIFRRLGKTVLLVTHDLAEAALLGEELWLMREGRIVQRGTLTDLRERPAEPFVERFVRAQGGAAPSEEVHP